MNNVRIREIRSCGENTHISVMGLAMSPFSVCFACSFFSFIFSVHGHVFAESNDHREDNLDWVWAVRKINDLERIVKVQDERIAKLEKRPPESEWKSIVELRETVQKQNERIRQLEERIHVSEVEAMVKVDEIKSILFDTSGQVSDSKLTTFSPKKSFIRKERATLEPTTLPTQSFAFFAYLSSNNLASSPHHILAFDTVITNVGNAYHAHSGTFIAHRSGLYVFTWTVRMGGHDYHSTELVHNNNVINSIYLDPMNAMQGTVSGTAVVNVSQGDDVLIRTGLSYSNGVIISDTNGRSSFAGWILM